MVFPTIYAGNKCSQRGNIYTSKTLSLERGELSTIDEPSGATSALNFQDLPCPPPSVQSEDPWFIIPGVPYRPLLSAPSQIWEIEESWSDCVTAQYNFFDPPIAVPSAPGLSDPNSIRHHHGPAKRSLRGVDAVPTLDGLSRTEADEYRQFRRTRRTQGPIQTAAP